MKISLVILVCLFSLTSLSQQSVTILPDVSSSKFDRSECDTIHCEHFLKAHFRLKEMGLGPYTRVVDYPILKYINDTDTCTEIGAHDIREQDLKEFIYVILTKKVIPE